MLHRKLILTLGSLVVMMLATSIWAIVLFALAVNDLSEMGDSLLRKTSAITMIETELGRIEARLSAMQDDPAQGPGDLSERVVALQQRIEELAAARPTPQQQGADLTELSGQLAGQVQTLEQSANAGQIDDAARAALNGAMALRQAVSQISADVQDRFDHRHAQVTARLRWWAFGLGLAFLLVINLSIMVIIRAAGMILKPVDELVEASRHLAAEEFNYRVPVHRRDEFGELARATNRMAEQLSLNEQRRYEMLQQIARTLNHELNNAISIIDLQLRLIERHGSARAADGANEQRLQQIHETLRKMSRTVASLTRVRKVVLTDYVGDVKMVDLQRSIEADDVQTEPAATHVEAHGS